MKAAATIRAFSDAFITRLPKTVISSPYSNCAHKNIKSVLPNQEDNWRKIPIFCMNLAAAPAERVILLKTRRQAAFYRSFPVVRMSILRFWHSLIYFLYLILERVIEVIV